MIGQGRIPTFRVVIIRLACPASYLEPGSVTQISPSQSFTHLRQKQINAKLRILVVQVLLEFLDLSAQDLQQHQESRENNTSTQELRILALGV
jgi:hypothetical protein